MADSGGLGVDASAEGLRLLIERAPDAIWINDGRRLVFANPATARLLDYPGVADVLALDPAAIIHPEDRAAMRERSQEMLRSGGSLVPREYRVRRRDGTWLQTEVHSMPIEWEGTPAILGFARDITARKEMESRLVRSDRLASMGTLLAGIAHEMNNPLTFAMLGLEQASAVVDALPASAAQEELERLLKDIRHGVDRVAGVVRQVRVSSRTEVRTVTRLDLESVVRSALRLAGNGIRHRARLLTEFQSAGPVLASAQLLEQVFLNLLVNATQALPEGRAENEIRVSLRPEGGDRVVVEVADNGVGIPPEVLPRVFDPFFTTKQVGAGMGLGLHICHDVVTAAGGSMVVDSAPGRGSVFRVNLPLAPAQTSEAPAAAPVPIAPAAVVGPPAAARDQRPLRRVLVIDDEAAIGEMIRRTLAGACEVEVVLDAESALSRLGDDSAPYDVILCDLMMPVMTGMDLYDRLQRERPQTVQHFVFMTGGAFTPGATDFLARVAAPLIEKPFDRRTLESLLGLS